MAIESLVLEAMRMLQQNKPEQAVLSKCGQAAHAEAVKRLQDQPKPLDLSTAQFAAKQAAEKRAFFQLPSSEWTEGPQGNPAGS